MNSATLILRILTFSLLISFNFSLYSQATPKVDLSVLKNKLPPSPTAAALGQYGEVPVSLYNGMPQVNVPITQLSGNDMTMPISLSYHASGNKVNQIASWVGLGFSLNAGGVITREVRDQPDDIFKINTDIDYCMYPCFNCTSCPTNDKPLICDNCALYRKIPLVENNIGYLYNGRILVSNLYDKDPNSFTLSERRDIFGLSSLVEEIELDVTEAPNTVGDVTLPTIFNDLNYVRNLNAFDANNINTLEASGFLNTHFLIGAYYTYIALLRESYQIRIFA